MPLFPKILRFNVRYVSFFNRRPGDAKFVRKQCPNIDKWLRTLYWDESEETNGAFKETVNFVKMIEGITKIGETDREFKLDLHGSNYAVVLDLCKGLDEDQHTSSDFCSNFASSYTVVPAIQCAAMFLCAHMRYYSIACQLCTSYNVSYNDARIMMLEKWRFCSPRYLC